jgi:hypothetical protein
MKSPRMAALSCLIVLSAASFATAQAPPDPKKLMAEQSEAMKALSAMDGVWRGPAETVLPTGEKHTITQTERIGPFLGGTVKVVEGRGYEPDGSVAFNALGIISYDPASKSYTMHSHAMGRKGDFKLTPTADGYVWEIPAGTMTIRYTAVIKDGKWKETGDRIVPGRDPVKFFEMNLVRVGDSKWPEDGAVAPK